MLKWEFISTAKKILIAGKKFETPGGGINTIKNVSDNGFSYEKPRKEPLKKPSIISVVFVDFYTAYVEFKNKKCSSNDLKEYAPYIFDSKAKEGKKGHSCNCTMFFMVLKEMKLIDKIVGKGVKGSPFYGYIK
jgi:hypothetical protein